MIGIGIEVLTHVLVNLPLQIDVDLSQRADDDVGADSAVDRDISPRIVEPDVRRIVPGRHADLSFRSAGDRQTARDRLLLSVDRCGEKNAGEKSCPMRYHRRMKRLLARLLFLPVVVLSFPAIAGEQPTVVYLVRHAEKASAEMSADPADPHLSRKGVRRAGELVRLLGEAGITQIHSTDFSRTIETVEPLAKRIDLEIELYEPSALESFASELKSQPGRHLVSGHSNTTPVLVELLGGDPGPPIVEATEYDRLYILFIGEETTTIVLRYGDPSE